MTQSPASPVPPSTEELDSLARKIMRQNDRGHYTIPTSGLYPYQWNWDSAFAAMGFAQFDIDRAWTELETLLSGQWHNGMLPHILFHQPDPGYFPGPDVWGCSGPIPSSGITQPPIVATMAKRIYERDPIVGKQRFTPLFKKLAAWHHWFMQYRLDKNAVCITHPWEAGRDNAPDWDGAMAAINPVGVGKYTRRDTSHVDSSMRPTPADYDRYLWLVQMGKRLNWNEDAMRAERAFRVADPSMTFTLLRAQRDLAALGHRLVSDSATSPTESNNPISADINAEIANIETAIKQLEAGAQTLWNHQLGSYDSRDAISGEWSNTISNASFLCWYAGLDTPAMGNVLTAVMEKIKYGIPSCDPRSAKFDAQRYWRGPVWAMMNMLIGTGMQEIGLSEADTLLQSSRALISKHGFAEYFDPRDGTPAGGKSFTWTAATWLGWASPSATNAMDKGAI